MEPFFIRHVQSSKLVHPKGGTNPGNDDPLVIYTGGAGEYRIQLQFVPVHGEGHFGYIEHMQTRRIVHPENGRSRPKNDTKLVFHEDRHVGALFMYDSIRKVLVHKSGKNWRSNSGKEYPNDDTLIVLCDREQEGARFEPVNSSLDVIDFYPTPTLGGSWKIINAVIDPKAERTTTVSYTVGKSNTKSASTQHAWSVSAGISIKWFEASDKYSGHVAHTQETIWQESKTVEYVIKVIPGETVVTWQWNFSAEQYDEEMMFSSTILRDTSSLHTPPSL